MLLRMLCYSWATLARRRSTLCKTLPICHSPKLSYLATMTHGASHLARLDQVHSLQFQLQDL